MSFISPVADNIGSRINHIIDLPLDAFEESLITISGVAYGFKALAYAFFSVGFGVTNSIKQNQKSMESKLGISNGIVSNVYRHSIGVLYPATMQGIGNAKSRYLIDGGVITEQLGNELARKAGEFSRKGFLQRHVIARLTYAVTIVALTIARIADFALGILVGAFSILPLLFISSETHSNIGRVAYDQLKITGIIKDLFVIGARVINPQLGLNDTYSTGLEIRNKITTSDIE